MVITEEAHSDNVGTTATVVVEPTALEISLGSIMEKRDYRQQMNRFKKFVDSNTNNLRPLNPNSSKPIYLTHENIDTFFAEDVAKRNVGSQAIGKVLPSLQWYADYREHIGKGFCVKSQITATSLVAQKNYYNSLGGTGKPGQDPHKALKDNLPLKDRIAIMDCIYSGRNNWGTESFVFTWGSNAAVRGASTQSLVFADLKVSRGFGAEEEGKLDRALITILRKGPLHKDRHDKDDQVAVWRHKNYKLCSIFSTAAHVLWTLKHDPPDNFLHDDMYDRASWWDKPIINWNDTDEASKAMNQIYAQTKVVNCKVTHHRTAALQYAGFLGLGPHQVNTMTNHIIEKQSSAYGPVAERETCKTMSGYKREDPYLLERGKSNLAESISWYEEKLFGQRVEAWRAQAASPDGDKSTCCENFLDELIPWFIEVLVQDGIYFIQDFPNHPVSRWLCNSIPGYELWAQTTRRQVKERTDAYELGKLCALNGAALAAFQNVHRQVADLQEENKKLLASQDRQENKITELLDLFRGFQLQWPQEARAPQPPPPQEARAPPPPPVTPAPQAQQQPARQPPTRTVNDALRPRGRQPAFPTDMPATMSLVYRAWLNCDMESFIGAQKKRWNHNIRLAYDKREYLICCMKKRKREDQSMEQVATAMDAERRQHGARFTVSKYLKWLKGRDDNVVHREYPPTRQMRAAAIQAAQQRVVREQTAVPVGLNRQRAPVTTNRLIIPPHPPPPHPPPPPQPLVNENRVFTVYGDPAPRNNTGPRRAPNFWAGRRSTEWGFGDQHGYGYTSNQRFDPMDEDFREV